jgi:O-antigen/teichoic acid export membrane protein
MSIHCCQANHEEELDGVLSKRAEERVGPVCRMGLAHAVAWTGAATWATQLVTWGYMIVVARMLAPSDYGLVGMANVLLGLLTVASEFGVSNAIIRFRDLTRDQVSQLNTVAVLSGIALFGIACLAAYPLGHFFRAPDLPLIVVALGSALLISSLKTVPDALLRREFRFKLLAKIQAAQAITYGIAAIFLALLGASYWSLVTAGIIGVVVSTLLVLRSRRHSFAWPKIAALRESLVFSTHVLGLRVAWYCSSNADFAVAGRVLGKAALGLYGLAWSIAEQPQQKFSDLVTRVVPSYFSKAQNDLPALREYVLTITQALSLLILPITLGIALIADDFVAATLGPRWMAAALPLRILAAYTATRSITSFFAPLLNMTGQSRFVMWNHIAAALYLGAAFYLGSRWGIVGIAVVWPLFYPFVAMPLYIRVFKTINLPLQAYIASLQPALSGSLIMVVSLLILRSVLQIHAVYLRLAIDVIGGAAIYSTAVGILYSRRLRRLYTLIWPVRREPALAPEGH